VAAVTAASYAGAAFAFGVTPGIVLNGGWQAAFFVFGTAAVVWVPFWLPAEFKVVNDVNSFGGGGGGGGGAVNDVKSGGGIGGGAVGATDSNGGSGGGLVSPSVVSEWLALVKTREVQAICIAQFAQSWGGYGLLSWLPTYFDEALGVPLGDLPAFTVLPFFIQGLVGVGSGVWADGLVREGKYSVKFIRRSFQTVGMLGPAACLLLAASPLGGAYLLVQCCVRVSLPNYG
jgi:ACS family sodium-dependent inorganic phosphate cotransporter